VNPTLDSFFNKSFTISATIAISRTEVLLRNAENMVNNLHRKRFF